MDSLVKLKIPILAPDTLIKIEDDCVVCGEEIAETHTLSKDSDLKEWQPDQLGIYHLASVYDAEHRPMKVKVDAKLGLCEKHFNQINAIEEFESMLYCSYGGIALVLLVIYFVFFYKRIVTPFDTNGPVLFFLICAPVITLTVLFFGFSWIFRNYSSQKAKKEAALDVSQLKNEDILGIEMEITQESGNPGNEVQYWLEMKFHSAKIAKKVLEKFPQATIVYGKKYLEEIEEKL